MDSRTTIEPAGVLVLADGKSESARSNARGHLFEQFMARVFQAYGCVEPKAENINIRSQGIEIDIRTQLELTRDTAIAECKAYSSNLPASELMAFYGKVNLERLTNPSLHGWFVVIPDLTKDGNEAATKILASDTKFRVIRSHDIIRLVADKGWLNLEPEVSLLLSDRTLCVTEHGLFGVAKRLEPGSRLPTEVRVWGPSDLVPDPVMELLAGSDFAAKLPILPLLEKAGTDKPSSTTPATAPLLVAVKGSSSDFEYQFPASPKFFVGRQKVLDRLSAVADSACKDNRGAVVVLNAQSGWGKSSVALAFEDLIKKRKGHAVAFDTRTAMSPAYLWAALQHAAEEAQQRGVLRLPGDAAFGSFQSCLRTFERATWDPERGALLVFFDQFENIFQDTRLTREFRDLALATRDVPGPLIIGFAWKTDLVGWTEKHPYQFRDDIRQSGTIVPIEPFGPTEVGTLLSRLAKATGTKLSQDLRQRVREYSQGLPWLLKKLSSHLLEQIKAGTSEETLLQEALNVQALFQADLAELQPKEVDALRTIARRAPVLVKDVAELIQPDLLQSLVNRRLLVRVGDSLDLYWDIFRDFLVTGKVAIQDTYILRLRPRSTAPLLKLLISNNGDDLDVTEAAQRLGTTPAVIFNAARELRQVGILSPRPQRIALADSLRQRDGIREDDVRMRVAAALKRHRAYEEISAVITTSAQDFATLEAFARVLPAAFPAVVASEKTWRTYADAFCQWFAYAGLVSLKGQRIYVKGGPSKLTLLGAVGSGRPKTFPQVGPKPTITVLLEVAGRSKPAALRESTRLKALTNLYVLGVVDENGTASDQALLQRLVSEHGEVSKPVLRELLGGVPGGAAALELLESNPAADGGQVGLCLREGHGADWSDTTTKGAGKYFRSWATAAGIQTRRRQGSLPGR